MRFAAWAGVCPGNHESAGKRHNARTKAGAKHLRTVRRRSSAKVVSSAQRTLKPDNPLERRTVNKGSRGGVQCDMIHVVDFDGPIEAHGRTFAGELLAYALLQETGALLADAKDRGEASLTRRP